MNCRFWMLWSFFAFATMLVTIGFLVLRSVTGLSDLESQA